MKLTTFILLTTCLTAAAAGHSQGVTLNVKDAPLERVFTEIRKQTGYNFLFSSRELKAAGKVTVQVSNASVEQILALCFKDKPFTYVIENNTITVIARREERPTKQPPPNADGIGEINNAPPPIDIHGKIVNEKGEPVAASVVVKGTNKGTTTNDNGEFELKGVDDNAVLVISGVSIETFEVKVNGRNELALNARIKLTKEDEVTVSTGYWTTTKRLSTGNIAKVTSDEIEKQPVMNPLQALQGRVPGLVVTQTSGYSSAPYKIELRGRSSIDPKFTSDPLYIVDGVPLTVLELSTGNYNSGSLGYLQNGFNGPAIGQSPFFSLNPNEIESIEVLKDADATSIYGSRGANGVILITTKKAKAGKNKFEVNIYQGINKVTRHWDMLNTQQYLQMRNEAFQNNSRSKNVGNAYDLLLWDTTRYTDWQKFLWGGTGKTTDAQMSYGGGSNNTQFRVSAGYHRQTDILTVSGADQRGSLSFNINNKTIDQKLNLSFSGNYSFTKSDLITTPSAVTLPPNAPAVFDANGKLNYAGWEPVRASFPFASLLQPYVSKTNNLISNLVLNYQVIKGLSLRSSFGYMNTQVNQFSSIPILSQDSSLLPVGSSTFGNETIQNWIVEPQVEYGRMLSKGSLNILVGTSFQDNSTEGTVTYATGYTNDALLNTPSLAPLTSTTGTFGKYKYAALFSRINYNWEDKYILNLSVRRDGSSRFGPGKQFGNFGAAGVAWIFTEEPFIKDHFHFLSFGKIRASYGTTGSDAISDYKYLTRWSSSTAVPPYLDFTALEPLQHYNPDYHWQVNRKLEAGINLGFLKDRISVAAAWYRNRCDNQLIDFPVPLYTGFASVTDNSPAAVQNTGWEFSLSSQIIRSKNTKWSFFSNIAFNKNKLLAYPNLEQSPYAAVYVIGQPLNIRKLLHYTGVDPTTGKYTFEDRDKDGNIDRNPGSTDDRFFYNLSPKYFGGFGTSVTYKSLEIYAFFNYIKQIGVNALNSTAYPGTIANQPTEVLNRWQKLGDVTNVARFTTLSNITDANFHIFSDGVYTDASFIRMQNFSISYNLPESLTKKAGMQRCRLFLQGQNLFTITKYKGIDPETRNFGSMPPAKIFTGGLNFNF